MSNPPNTEDGHDGAFPSTTGEFLTLYALLVLVWTTGSWVYKASDWSDQGFSDASPGQIVGSLAGGAVSYFAMIVIPVVVWRAGRMLPRRHYLSVSLGLLILGVACLGFGTLVENGGPVTTWPERLLIALIVQPTLSGVLGLGHYALLIRRERK